MIAFSFLLFVQLFCASRAFVPHRSTFGRRCLVSTDVGLKSNAWRPPVSSSQLNLSISNVDEWRQYVPLVVSALVIVDIVSGSPVLNSILQKGTETDEEGSDNAAPNVEVNPRERVDSVGLANEAVEKARNMLEYQRRLELDKTPEMEMDRLKREMDREMETFEKNRKKNS